MEIIETYIGLARYIGFSRSETIGMVQAGIFKPLLNPLRTNKVNRQKQRFLKTQVDETMLRLANDPEGLMKELGLKKRGAAS